jgi:hypothetical protein
MPNPSSWMQGSREGSREEQHREGRLARSIEEQTAKLPSDVFLWSALAAVVGALVLHGVGKRDESNFVGQWVPTLLILGLYNKIVKVAGSDAIERERYH